MNSSVSFLENMNSFEKGNGFFPDDVVVQILARLPIKDQYMEKVYLICSEAWKKITLPGEIVNSYGRGNRIYLLELEGAVSVIQISADWMSIWVLKDYVREEWLLADRVSLRCIKAFIPSAFPISQNRDFVFLATQRQILIYGRRNKVWKELYSVRTATAYPLWFSAHAFRSTLFSCRQNLQCC
ncbi:hypothetical protein MRB53_010529 [Persea americana]|uniref:Uncharacterized protein n=1 Tax=Persea americana TaxID=3435 RepID=A0ACC2LS80_PERAE|nr:hypothetical protein MRB53_010529 [Persea americana]